MSRKVLLLDGHPAKDTLCGALLDAYGRGAKAAGHELRLQSLSQMAFDPDFGTNSFAKAPALEPGLEAFWQDLLWCEHLVLAHPLWWGGMPAKLKGLFDRVLLPGKAFQYEKGKMLPEGLLKGRSCQVLLTADTPGFFLKWVYGYGVKKQTDRQILKFCGIKPNRFTEFAPVLTSTPARREKWLAKAVVLGRQVA